MDAERPNFCFSGRMRASEVIFRNWRKNGIVPRPTTYQSRRSTRQGQTVDLLSVRGPKKKAEMLVGALPERVEPRN